jgi:hypothetical protein
MDFVAQASKAVGFPSTELAIDWQLEQVLAGCCAPGKFAGLATWIFAERGRVAEKQSLPLFLALVAVFVCFR